jgi:hypothetical protein
MGHQIIVGITDAAQRAALLAGQPAANVQRYELCTELLARALDLGAQVDSSGQVTLRWALRDDGSRNAYAPELLGVRPVDAAACLDAIEAIVAAERAACDAKIAHLIDLVRAAPIDRLASRSARCASVHADVYAGHDLGPWSGPGGTRLWTDEQIVREAGRLDEVRALLASWDAEDAAAAAESAAADAAREAAREAARVAAEAARHEALTAAVEHLGSDEQRAAWAAGVLAQREVIGLLDRAVRSMLADAQCRIGSHDGSVSAVDTLPTAEATALLAMRRRIATLPARLAGLELRATEIGFCRETGDTSPMRYTVDLSVAVGPIAEVYTIVLS